MKKIYSLLVMIVVCKISLAQISLDASMAPPVGTMMIFYDANVPSPPFTYGTSGTTNTWDFTAVTPASGAEDTVYYLDPASYPLGSAFPGATHATYEAGDASVTMLSVDAYFATYLGIIGDPINSGTPMAVLANPPAISMSFPWTYGSTANATTSFDIFATGAAIGQPSIDSVHLKNTGIFDAEVIAAGDMILPSGTLQALLERRINTTIDSAWVKSATLGNIWMAAPNFPTTETDSSFYWYSNQSLQRYAAALYDNTGLHDVTYYMSTTTGVKNISLNNQVAAYPNPTHDFLGVKGLDLPAASEWTIYSTKGEKMMEGKSNLNSVDVQNFSNGTYILRMTTPAGQVHELKFVKY